MKDAQPRAVYRKDYRPAPYLIEETHLDFQLFEDHTLVGSRLFMRRRSDADAPGALVLQGRQLELLSLSVDGLELSAWDYDLTDESLSIHRLPEQFELRCETRIRPQDNKSLEGLYKSRSMFCSQCEAEGFRRITYYLDRPDVMSIFTVRVEADRRRYPVLLSNGNKTDSGVAGQRHWARWHDPFAKPCYLFALVAGDLACLRDGFTTRSGRDVALCIYVDRKDLDKCEHAMRSLKASMRWDEEVFGREYDLDVFNIVAVDDFNMGAMENKSLNIFNTACVLANPATTTDTAFQRVAGVVAHEYFHNWSGNRVTCRDWFQLSLKEGFTVYRDAEFSADTGSRTVKRIEDVVLLRTAQFAEDSGPLAHPVRPDSFIEISNFYTMTIYEKGAEVVRMIRTLLGPEAFRAGSDLYFERHDGQAVTCDDFVQAMEDASGRDLSQFRRWYSQAGTPQLDVSSDWNEAAGTLTLMVAQSCPPTPGQAEKRPLVVPLAMGLIGEAGALPLKLPGESANTETSDATGRILELTQARQSFTFTGLPERPVPSLLRGFSAPVKLSYPYSDEELARLMSRDDDDFCRWDACQQLAQRMIAAARNGEADFGILLDACRSILEDRSLDPAIMAEMLRLPTLNYLIEASELADVRSLHSAREQLRAAVGESLKSRLRRRYRALASAQPYRPDAAQIAARSLRNTCLSYLAFVDGEGGIDLALEQYREADNMTDQQAALAAIVDNADEARSQAVLGEFYARWQRETLVVNQWFQVQAVCPRPGAVDRVRSLMKHPDFDVTNPNKVRSLVGAFSTGNPLHFHQGDGEGYRLLAEVVAELDGFNPQIAARLLTPLTRWRRFAHGQAMMREQLGRLAAIEGLSPDLYEVVNKSL